MNERRFGWATVRAVAVGLVVGATLVLVWSPLVGWGGELTPVGPRLRHVFRVPDDDAVRDLLVFGPVLTAVAGLLVVALRTPWLRLRWVRTLRVRVLRVRVLRVGRRLPAAAATVAAVAAAGGAAVLIQAWAQLSRVDGSPVDATGLHAWNAPPYAPVTVLAAAALMLGWALLVPVLVVGRVRAVWRVWSGAAVATVLTVLAAVGAVGAVAYGTRLDVDHRTAEPLPDRPPGVPKAVAWRTTTEGLATVVDRYVVTAVADGIVVRDAATGREHWHYRRQMFAVPPPETGFHRSVLPTAPRFGVSLDRRTVVTLWSRPGDTDLLAGFDLATGDLLWTRGQKVDLPGQVSFLFQVGDTAVITRGASVDAVDVRTGRTWRWQPPDGCATEELAQAPDVLVAAVACEGGTTRIIGVSAADGAERWTWQPPSAGLSGDTIAVVGTSVRVLTRSHGDFGLDAATGAVRQPGVAPDRTSAAEEILRGPEVTAYLDTSRWEPKITGVGEAGDVRWETPVPELARAVVSGTAVSGGVGYALLVPTSPGGTSPSIAFERRLLAFDLATGAVLAVRDFSLPSECVCRVGSPIYLDLVLLAGDGVVAVFFLERPSSQEEWRYGLVAYA